MQNAKSAGGSKLGEVIRASAAARGGRESWAKTRIDKGHALPAKDSRPLLSNRPYSPGAIFSELPFLGRVFVGLFRADDGDVERAVGGEGHRRRLVERRRS